MADYFLSDIHLRIDRPERGNRLATFVDSLGAGDQVFIVGDLCDFWFVSRQYRTQALLCPGLQSLQRFSGRGGQLIILGGNHDFWLGSFYEQKLGATWNSDKLRMNSHGVQLLITHGHRFGARSLWKAAMESRLFFWAFGALPAKLAEKLEARLEHSNEAHRTDDDLKHVELYRKSISKLSDTVDIVVLGHIHIVVDEIVAGLRMIILGSWIDQISYLRIDDSGASMIVENHSTASFEPFAIAQ